LRELGKQWFIGKHQPSAESTRLGVRPDQHDGTVTILGGVIMPPEVMAAMEEAAQHSFQCELLEKSGST
jgi:hypothetical protein